MSFVPIKVKYLLAIIRTALDLAETIDEVIEKNIQAHQDSHPETELNVSQAVADRVMALQPVSTETVGDQRNRS